MDDDDNTTFYVTFKDTTHNLGVIDPDKLSRVSVINKVLMTVYGRRMTHDEKFNLNVWQSWERKKVQIVDDHDLIVQLQEHHNRLCYHMQLYLDEIHLVTESTTKRALFQTSEDITSAAPKTSIPVIIDQNNLVSNVPPTSISANSDLFEDFMDIYFRSSTGQQTVSPNQSNKTDTIDTTSDSSVDKTSSNCSDETPQRKKITKHCSISPQLQQQQQMSYLREPKPDTPNAFPTQPTQNPDSQKSIRTEPTASTYNFDDNDYCLTESVEEDPYHPRGAANVINSLAPPIDQANEGYIHSDDSDVDCILSNCDSDDNEFGEDSNDEINKVLAKMDATMRENMYIPSEDPVVFRIGQYFRNFRQLSWALRNYAVENRFKMFKHKFERSRITVGCAFFQCPWFLHAAKTRFEPPFLIKRLHNVHTCQRDLKTPKCTAEFIAVKFASTFIEQPDTKVEWFISKLRRRYGVKVNKHKIYRAKKKVLECQCADHESSYRLVRNYAQMILNKMPQALALVSVTRYHAKQPKTYFDKFVVSFPALRECFNQGCRLFLGIDRCHLKGPYKGVLLPTVAINANDGIFLIAFCVCSVESTSTWTWFLRHLNTFLGDNRQLTFMCDRHILANLKAKHPLSDFKPHFWAAARFSNRRAFDRAMEELRKTDEGVYETLRKLPAKFWSRHAFDNNCKSDHYTNNVTESFNAWKAMAWGNKIPRRIYDKKMTHLKIGSVNPISRASEWLYDVDDSYKTYIVDLEHHVCDCGYWQVSGIPCIHAMPCISHSHKDQVDFLSPWLKKDTYIRGYSGMIHPIPDKDSWPNPGGDEILPSLMKMPLGRPKINRRREADEVPPESKRYRLQCKCCKEFGHNKRGCPANPENLNKRTRLYKHHLRSYLTRREGEKQAAALEGPACASIIALRQTSDNIQVAVEVEDIRTYNLRNSKKHKIATQAGPSASKNLVKRKRWKEAVMLLGWGLESVGLRGLVAARGCEVAVGSALGSTVVSSASKWHQQRQVTKKLKSHGWKIARACMQSYKRAWMQWN
ncbi:SWIM-type domain-containing protein [Citrus sinensis]|uniref:SWIM-type domain-containing protein n=1 Tax=Citrus sinensis TaxID=2711 RepID=A0ACB8IK27_CITSI|nr:SWIM-type domain-containing protein [Citrus sinensis]